MSQTNNNVNPSLFGEFLRDWTKWGLLWAPIATAIAMFVFTDLDKLFSDTLGYRYVISLAVGETVVFCCLGGSYVLSVLEATYYEWKGWIYKEKTNLQHIARSVVFVLPGMWLGFKFGGLVAELMGVTFSEPDIDSYRRGFLIGGISMLVYLGYDLWQTKNASEKRMRELEKESLEAKVKALSSQMNPHLLFNALNSVAATIPENPDAAEDMTVELANLYRAALEASKRETHTLERELAVCELYLKVEKSRFTSRLRYTIDPLTKELADLEIPTLLLQPIVENAVKHGIAPKEEGGVIDVSIEDLGKTVKIVIADSGIGMGKASSSGTGTALQNCRNRLALTYGDRGSFSIDCGEPGTRVTFEIPRKKS